MTFGGSALIVIFGLGHTTGNTFLAISSAGLRLMRFSSGVVSSSPQSGRCERSVAKEFIVYIIKQYFIS